jgi:hypothetical protein
VDTYKNIIREQVLDVPFLAGRNQDVIAVIFVGLMIPSTTTYHGTWLDFEPN